MNVHDFIRKWRDVQLTEKSASHEHFIDLCNLLDHPTPVGVDKTGEEFTFEKGAAKHGGGDGWADVWKKGYFGWEYKGKHKDLDAAYDQLLKYREALENPPLLVCCDMDRIVIHTNFTATPVRVYEISLDDLAEPANLERLRWLFHDFEKLRPGVTSAKITEEAAERLAGIAQALRARGLEPHEVARFLDRIIFCLFAEDIGLLRKNLFSEIVAKGVDDPDRFKRQVAALFDVMATGGDFGAEEIKHFNGDLFTAGPVLDLTSQEIGRIRDAAKLDWSAVDPSIFGTLFERGLDPGKRAQIGAHYTSREDIETLVEPVVMWPLRREWDAVRADAESLLATGKPAAGAGRKLKPPAARKRAASLVHGFLERLWDVKMLDPACGSGNFLYVTLQRLKDLEKAVCVFADDNGIGGFLPHVGPQQLYGIEINPYAFELAQMTVWIGYIQWTVANGYGMPDSPILRKLGDNFQCKDAVLELSSSGKPKEPTWPKVDFIVGNPPFLGGKKMRTELGDEYMDALFALWRERVRPEADLCCYWFEKARAQVEEKNCERAGLLATQGIRGGANRDVLQRIKDSGDIFFAESDRPWILEGANVHVSMVGFDSGTEERRQLDGQTVETINSNLTAIADITTAKRLQANEHLSFMGTTKGGAFDIDEETALGLLQTPSPSGRPCSDVIVPWVNGKDITARRRQMFVIDFGCDMNEADAASYEAPFEYAKKYIKTERQKNRREAYRRLWWLHVEARPALRESLGSLSRYLCTPRVSKYRFFVWLNSPTLPDSATFAFARSDDYFFGVLHSRLHEVWALATGTQLREKESGFRYTPTTCFETFPFPEPTPEQERAIAAAAADLDRLRNNWLNPPEWVREDVLEFPGSVDGPWKRYLHDPDASGIGTVRYPRLVPKDADAAKQLQKRTLTNLYNQRPTWLDHAHKTLDAAVFAAYGWAPAMSDEEILAALLELNLVRSGA